MGIYPNVQGLKKGALRAGLWPYPDRVGMFVEQGCFLLILHGQKNPFLWKAATAIKGLRQALADGPRRQLVNALQHVPGESNSEKIQPHP